LFSLEYSISLGEDMNWCMFFPILTYLFLIFLPSYAFLQISLDSFDWDIL
jgi:hypothetical protein